MVLLIINETWMGLLSFSAYFIWALFSYAIAVKLFGLKKVFRINIENSIVDEDKIIIINSIKLKKPYFRKNEFQKVKNRLTLEEFNIVEKESKKSKKRFIVLMVLFLIVPTIFFIIIRAFINSIQ